MNILFVILAILAAYLLGSIPTAVWVGEWLHGIDIREHGSGNAGTANTMRVLGIKTGIPVLIVDVFKGWMAVEISLLLPAFHAIFSDIVTFQLILGAAAVLGHIFPLFAGFRGGKGVATLLGIVLAIHPLSTLLAVGVFVITLLLVRIISVASVAAGISFPFFIWLLFPSSSISLKIFSLAVALLLIFTHRSNIKRLLHGEEPITSFLFGTKDKRDK